MHLISMMAVGGFTKQELEDLRIELGHHHDKWKQFKDLVNLVSSYEDNENMVDNSLPDYKDIAKLRDEMDVKQRQVENSYRRLKVKVLQGAVDEEYHDHRVRDLWKRAKAQGLSGDELDIIKVCSSIFKCGFFTRCTYSAALMKS